jgi:hypothetical protein
MIDRKWMSDEARRDWYADQLLRALVAAILIGASAWVGYASAAARLSDDAAKWRQVAAAYEAAPDVGVALLRTMLDSD